jgi:deoxyribodipyrimidine photolyase
VWTGEAWRPGGASRLWQRDALQAFDASLQGRYGPGARIINLPGPSAPALMALCGSLKVGAVYANWRHEPAQEASDAETVAALKAEGLEVRFRTNRTCQWCV